MPMSNRIYKQIKWNVESEKSHREPLDILWETFTKRLGMLGMGLDPESVMINKPVLKGNWTHDRPSTPQSLAQLHPGGKAELETLLDNIGNSRKLSIYKQKFYTYVYNKDKANATKYHTKLITLTSEMLEDITDAMEEGEEVKVGINKGAEGGAEVIPEEGGYLAVADEFKRDYDFRKKLLEYM